MKNLIKTLVLPVTLGLGLTLGIGCGEVDDNETDLIETAGKGEGAGMCTPSQLPDPSSPRYAIDCDNVSSCVTEDGYYGKKMLMGDEPWIKVDLGYGGFAQVPPCKCVSTGEKCITADSAASESTATTKPLPSSKPRITSQQDEECGIFNDSVKICEKGLICALGKIYTTDFQPHGKCLPITPVTQEGEVCGIFNGSAKMCPEGLTCTLSQANTIDFQPQGKCQ
jgi:hypothetical protein